MAWTSENSRETATDAATPTPRYRCRLQSVGDCRAELSKVYRLSRSGALPVDHASKYAHILSIVARIIETSDLEQRVAAIEAKG